MANEAICIETPSRFARYTIAAGAVLPFGTLCKIGSDLTVVASDSADDSFAGIVWEIASTTATTHTEITLALDGVWDIKATTATQALGVAVALGGANLTVTADAGDLLNGAFMGFVEEAASNDEVVRTRLTKFGSSGQL